MPSRNASGWRMTFAPFASKRSLTSTIHASFEITLASLPTGCRAPRGRGPAPKPSARPRNSPGGGCSVGVRYAFSVEPRITPPVWRRALERAAPCRRARAPRRRGRTRRWCCPERRDRLVGVRARRLVGIAQQRDQCRVLARLDAARRRGLMSPRYRRRARSRAAERLVEGAVEGVRERQDQRTDRRLARELGA